MKALQNIVERKANDYDCNYMYSILIRQHELYVDLDDDELKKELTSRSSITYRDDSVLGLYQKECGITSILSGKSDIEAVINNISSSLNYPDSIFIINMGTSEAINIREKYGVICMPENDISIKYLTYKKSIQCISEQDNHYWEEFLVDLGNIPINSVIINDRYIFQNKGACDNLKKMIHMLFKNKQCQCTDPNTHHVLITFAKTYIYDDYKRKIININNDNNNNIKDFFIEIVENVRNKLSSLIKSKKIMIELLCVTDKSYFFKYTHNRALLTNYSILNVEHQLANFDMKHYSDKDQNIFLRSLYSDGINDKSDLTVNSHNLIIDRYKDVKDDLEKSSHEEFPQYLYACIGSDSKEIKMSVQYDNIIIKNRLIKTCTHN